MKQRTLQPTREHPYLAAVDHVTIQPGLIIAAAMILSLIFLTWLIFAAAEAANILGAGSYV